MKENTIAKATLIAILIASPLALAKDVIHTFHANDNKYEVYVGYKDYVYVKSIGVLFNGASSNTNYVKGSGYAGCNWKYYGRCVSYYKMISDIKYKVRYHKY